jgi:DNA helicase II / ATP-dependent DNA helicase PcrA
LIAALRLGNTEDSMIARIVNLDEGDRHVYASRTRFIPEGLLGLFDRTSWLRVAVAAPTIAAGRGVRINVGARMRGMWR